MQYVDIVRILHPLSVRRPPSYSERDGRDVLSPIPGEFDNLDNYFKTFEPLMHRELQETIWAEVEALDHNKDERRINIEDAAFSRSFVLEVALDEKSSKNLVNGSLLLLKTQYEEKFAVITNLADSETEDGKFRKLQFHHQNSLQDLDVDGPLAAYFLTSIASFIRMQHAIESRICPPGMASSILRQSPGPVSQPTIDYTIDFLDEPVRMGVAYTQSVLAGSLNAAQESALYAGLQDIDPITLIHGPPGTGKTTVITQIIASNVLGGRLVVSTAPANAAVREVALRCLSTLKEYRQPQYPDGCIDTSDIVLIGNEDRMDLSTGLEEIFLDFRIDRLNEARDGLRKVLADTSLFLDYFPMKFMSQISPDALLKFTRGWKSSLVYDINTHLLPHCADSDSNMLRDPLFEFTTELKGSLTDMDNYSRVMISESPRRGNIDELVACLKCARECLGRLPEPRRIDLSFQFLLSLAGVPTSNLDFDLHLFLDLLKQLRFAVKRATSSFNSSDKTAVFLPAEVLRHAKLFFSTISSCGRGVFMSAMSTVEAKSAERILIVDEAAQAMEVSTLIPLTVVDPDKLILVGDDKQLPAIVTSQTARDYGLGRSLFERLKSQDFKSYLLNTQYRMHPLISHFPSAEFYDKSIVDAPSVLKRKLHEEWCHSESHFRPYQFFNIPLSQERMSESGSKYNEFEVKIIHKLLNDLYMNFIKTSENIEEPLTIGIISGYAKQVELISACIPAVFAKELSYSRVSDNIYTVERATLEIGSVDSFQGQERDIIILSTVRSNEEGNIGFLNDQRRLNVAITRAKHSLYVIGNDKTLKSNPMWNKLLRHCFSNEGYVNLIEHKRFRSYISEVKRIAAMIHQAREETPGQAQAVINPMGKEYPWKMLISKPALDNLHKFATDGTLMGKIDSLHKGTWGKGSLQRVSGSSLLCSMRCGNNVVLWSLFLDIIGEEYVQVIKIWAVSDMNKSARAVEHIKGIICNLADDLVTRCEKPDKLTTSKSGVVTTTQYIPKKFPREDRISFYKAAEAATEGTIINTGDDETDPASYMKSYLLDSQIITLLTGGNMADINLPFQMSDDEHRILQYPTSLMIVGRSGTGKTTVMIQKMHARNLALGSVPDLQESLMRHAAGPRQLMVTLSSQLCLKMKEYYDKMLNTATVVQGQPETEDNGQVQFWTLREFLRTLDSSLAKPFFARRKAQKVDALLVGQQESQSDAQEVDFRKFSIHYYPHLNQETTRTFSESYLWTEFQTTLKGSEKALGSPRGMSLETYTALAESRTAILTEHQMQMIFAAWRAYEKRKGERQEYDLGDATAHIYHELKRYGHGDLFDFIYMDEVQDFTQAQIALFQFVCPNNNGFMFAGDTAQTISSGVDFRFQDLRRLYYNQFLPRLLPDKYGPDATRVDMRTAGADVPPLKVLTENYRTHSGVLDVARTLVDALFHFFPNSIDKLPRETAICVGTPPTFIENTTINAFLLALFGKQEPGKVSELGAEQVIIVRDEDTRTFIAGILPDALVLTILESKGLEFQDVLIFNFFKGSPFRNWRLLYHLEKKPAIEQRLPTFDKQKDHGLCNELKALYVGVTRAKSRLLFFDEDANRQPMIDFWERSDVFVSILNTDDDSNLAPLARKSSPEEWAARGESFKSKLLWHQASKCFRHAQNPVQVNFCTAKALQQEAEELEAREQKKDALARFEEAALLFEKAHSPQDAGICYYNSEKYLPAIRCFRKSGDIPNALRTCVKGYLISQFVEITSGTDLDDKLVNECARALAVSAHLRKKADTVEKIVNCIRGRSGQVKILARYQYWDLLIAKQKGWQEYGVVAESYLLKRNWSQAIKYFKIANRAKEADQLHLSVLRQYVFVKVWYQKDVPDRLASITKIEASDAISAEVNILKAITRSQKMTPAECLQIAKKISHEHQQYLLLYFLHRIVISDASDISTAVDTWEIYKDALSRLVKLITAFLQQLALLQDRPGSTAELEKVFGLHSHKRPDYRLIDEAVYSILLNGTTTLTEIKLTDFVKLARAFFREILSKVHSVFGDRNEVLLAGNEQSNLKRTGLLPERQKVVRETSVKFASACLTAIKLSVQMDRLMDPQHKNFVATVMQTDAVKNLLGAPPMGIWNAAYLYNANHDPATYEALEQIKISNPSGSVPNISDLTAELLLNQYSYAVPFYKRLDLPRPPKGLEMEWNMWQAFRWLENADGQDVRGVTKFVTLVNFVEH
ncbi:hypothetical protein DFS34DRAFT_247146 [Phlyctochytrium arcticum]|nr:hypothetical protein DFS34DRAFT_247146 [Phlyctochytrium arcticum]